MWRIGYHAERPDRMLRHGRIILPLSKPVLAVVALFYGVAHGNDLFAATLHLNDAHKWPIQRVLRQYVRQGSAVNLDPNQPTPPTETM